MKKFKGENCILAFFKFNSGLIRPITLKKKPYWEIDIGCSGGGFCYNVSRTKPISLKEATRIFNKTLKEHYEKTNKKR